MSLPASAPGRVRVDGLSIHLGRGRDAFEAVQSLSFAIEPGEFVCVLGPSGCGKSTLLGALAGHLTPSAGQLEVDGASVAGPSPERGMVFQHHTLLPWRRVRDNVAFGLKCAACPGRAPSPGRRDAPAGGPGRLRQSLAVAALRRHAAARGDRPVLINQPRLLLMDEPFGALDAQTRMMMQELLLDIWTRLRTSVLFITHDIDEALFLADRLLVMSPRPGRILEDIRLDFPRPRHADLLTTAEFSRLKRHCLELLRHEDGRQLPRLTPLGLPTPQRIPRFAI
jgi:ABC-type nitrate/sulfonate/bicarbonate transport system, ATPase component